MIFFTRLLSLTSISFLICFLVSDHALCEDAPLSATPSVATPVPATPSLSEQIQESAKQMEMDPVIQKLRERMDETSGGTNNGDNESGPGDISGSGLEFSLLLWLMVLVVVIIGCGWMLRRFVGTSGKAPSGQIRVLASCSLSQRARLYIVQVGSQRFLIGEGGGSVSFLGSLPPSPDIERPPESESDASVEPVLAAEPESSTFADRLRQWEQSVAGQNVSGEVKASLRFLETLSRRLRRDPGADRGGG